MYRIVELSSPILFQEPDEWWFAGGCDLGDRLLHIYKIDALRDELRKAGLIRPLADLLLKVLEAECYAYEWLPGT